LLLISAAKPPSSTTKVPHFSYSVPTLKSPSN